MRVPGLEGPRPLLPKYRLACFENPHETAVVPGRRSVLVVDERDAAAHQRLVAGALRPEAVIRVLEVRLEVGAEGPDRPEHLAPDVGAGEDDSLHLPCAGVLPHVLLERPELLAPHRVRKDVRAGVEQAAVREDEAAAHDSGPRRLVGAGAQTLEPVELVELDVVVQQDDVGIRVRFRDARVVSTHEPEVSRISDDAHLRVVRQRPGGLVRRPVVDDEDLGARQIRREERVQAAPRQVPAIPGEDDERGFPRAHSRSPKSGGVTERHSSCIVFSTSAGTRVVVSLHPRRPKPARGIGGRPIAARDALITSSSQASRTNVR